MPGNRTNAGNRMTQSQESPPILPPEQAKSILEEAVADKIGENWQDPGSGWTVVTSHAYMARLNRGQTNIDFYVDHFSGEVTVDVREADQQFTGRTFAWMFIGLCLVIALLLGRGLGYI